MKTRPGKIKFNFERWAVTALPKAKLKAAAIIKRKLGKNWVYSTKEFQDVADRLLKSPELALQGNIIWQTSRNTVRRLTMPGVNGDFDIVYKSRPGRYRLNRSISASAAVRDATALLAMGLLDFPIMELLAVGEQRCITHWKNGFIVTRFAGDYKEVTHILPGGEYGNDPQLQEAVLRACLGALAELHKLRIFHKAFKHYNIMWKRHEDGVKLCLFDFETSRAIWLVSFEPYMLRDLYDFLKGFAFAEEELLRWLAFYLEKNTSCLASPKLLLEKLRPYGLPNCKSPQ